MSYSYEGYKTACELVIPHILEALETLKPGTRTKIAEAAAREASDGLEQEVKPDLLEALYVSAGWDEQTIALNKKYPPRPDTPEVDERTASPLYHIEAHARAAHFILHGLISRLDLYFPDLQQSIYSATAEHFKTLLKDEPTQVRREMINVLNDYARVLLPHASSEDRTGLLETIIDLQTKASTSFALLLVSLKTLSEHHTNFLSAVADRALRVATERLATLEEGSAKAAAQQLVIDELQGIMESIEEAGFT